jgi:N-acetylglucosamine-6-phosphate deacetylase
LEGPYLNTARKGIHDEALIRAVDPGALELFTSSGLGQVVVTLAPEVVDPDFIRALDGAGVRVCAGHTAASYDQTRRGLDAGVRGFNPPVQRDVALDRPRAGCGRRRPWGP